MPADGLPPELLNDDPAGFAWGVWHDRTPRLVARVRAAHPYGPAQRHGLDALLAEVLTGEMRPLVGAHDQDRWAAWGAGHFGRPWQEAPFLWSESYFYRRLLEAVDYFGPGPWQGVDPFEFLKSAELRDPDLEGDLAALGDLERLSVEERGEAKLLAALWGNRADLGFRIGRESGDAHPETDRLVHDDRALFWSALDVSRPVVLVADNAGRELLADLVLVDHLLEHGLASAVRLHLKPQPYMVSDATTADLVACLRRLAESEGVPAKIAHRLSAASADGRLQLVTHSFFCAPWSYHHLPADLETDFRTAALTIMKGDLNYRRLVGDRAWPATTPFSAATAYFPGPVAALRTLKSDVLTGVPAEILADLDSAGRGWRSSGTHGLLQVSVPGVDLDDQAHRVQ